jgi:hypothetical protein
VLEKLKAWAKDHLETGKHRHWVSKKSSPTNSKNNFSKNEVGAILLYFSSLNMT